MTLKRSLRIRSRFALVLVVLVPALLAVLAVGLHGLQSGRDSANVLYRDHQRTTQLAAGLDIALDKTRAASLSLLLADSSAEKDRLTQLIRQRSSSTEAAINAVAVEAADDPAQRPSAKVVAVNWSRFRLLLETTGFLRSDDRVARAAAARQITDIFDAAATGVQTIIRVEGIQARQAHAQALADYRSSERLMVVAGVLCLLSSVGVVVWLIRSVLPRTLAYSAFAAQISRGDYGHRLRPDGQDELAQLGRVLNDLAESRQTEDDYDRNQLELIDSLQLTESEQEAHELLKRHLERAIDRSEITVLNRNNSADRLQAVTPLAPDSPLIAGLESAKPRSCLAVRRARPHTTQPGQDSLLICAVCSGCPGLTTCTPLVVGGEVIGSVLTECAQSLTDADHRSIHDAVIQAAPVMGNLRNLAISELRAKTDSLTGLPNKRAIDDTLRRMVAQSSRSVTQLAALMCDLDHFKHINDRYGHGAGDDVLAAVGAIFTDSLRSSDFVGRYGGEEFIILLPDTNTDGARVIAEKLRAAVATIQVPTVDQTVTLSVGIAVQPDHAGDADSLQRAADQALYTAKNAGRNRVEVFTRQPPGTPDPPATPPSQDPDRRPATIPASAVQPPATT